MVSTPWVFHGQAMVISYGQKPMENSWNISMTFPWGISIRVGKLGPKAKANDLVPEAARTHTLLTDVKNYNKSLEKLQDFFFKTETKSKTS